MIVSNNPMLVMTPAEESADLESVMAGAGFYKDKGTDAFIKEPGALPFTESEALAISEQFPDTAMVFKQAFVPGSSEEAYRYSKYATDQHATRRTSEIFICKDGRDVLGNFVHQLSEDIAGNRFSLEYEFAKDLKSFTLKGTYETRTYTIDGYDVTVQTPFFADIPIEKPLSSLHVSFGYDHEEDKDAIYDAIFSGIGHNLDPFKELQELAPQMQAIDKAISAAGVRADREDVLWKSIKILSRNQPQTGKTVSMLRSSLNHLYEDAEKAAEPIPARDFLGEIEEHASDLCHQIGLPAPIKDWQYFRFNNEASSYVVGSPVRKGSETIHQDLSIYENGDGCAVLYYMQAAVPTDSHGERMLFSSCKEKYFVQDKLIGEISYSANGSQPARTPPQAAVYGTGTIQSLFKEYVKNSHGRDVAIEQRPPSNEIFLGVKETADRFRQGAPAVGRGGGRE